MNNQSVNEITAALTFKVPVDVGWSVQSGNQSWSGNELNGLFKRVAREGRDQPTILSMSLIIELNGNGGTVRARD